MVIPKWKEIFSNDIGYSDHTLGIEVAIAAVSLGARIIEKHFTLNKRMSGPDHSASLGPGELKSMVWAIRNIEKASRLAPKGCVPNERATVNKAAALYRPGPHPHPQRA